MLDELFNFPIVLIDGDNEDRKQENKLRLGDITPLNQEGEAEDEYDMIFGEAEYPYWDLVGIEDRWLPSEESLDKALRGRFEACLVRFSHVGQLLVPWTKKKFKAEITKFAEKYKEENPSKDKGRVLQLNIEQYKELLKDIREEEE
jgi:hypothetical protein